MSDKHVGYIGKVHEDLSNNPQCSVCGAVMVAGDPWKCLSCEGTVPAVSDEQVKGISEPGPLKRSFPTGKWTWIPDRPQDRPPFDWQSRMPVTDAMRQFYCDACEAYDNSDGSGDALSFEEVVVLQYAAERIARSEQALAALEARNRELESALRGFCDKIDEVEPHINNAFTFMAIHGGKYTGPNYAGEYKAARAALKGAS